MSYKGYLRASWNFNVEIIHDVVGSCRIIESDVYEFDLPFFDFCQCAIFPRVSNVQSGGFIDDRKDGDCGLLRCSHAGDVGSLSTETHVCKEKQVSAFEHLC